ncbi:hypothetical protein BDZ45DRAFT_70072 [Acephala macrosclerotiorum]|nr:hypothetical protein BDZ45DRAFT_70072 [Acephala macrosclerotiorum]
MSGRSARVRTGTRDAAISDVKKKVAEGRFIEEEPFMTELQKRQNHIEDIMTQTVRDPGEVRHHPRRPTAYMPASMVGVSPSNYRPRARSVGSEDNFFNRVRRPDISSIESNIEKSALRIALDTQSDQIRHTLGGIFTGKKKAKDSQLFKPHPFRVRKEVAELDSVEIKPGSLRSEPKSEPPNYPLPPISGSHLQRWIPGLKNGLPWDKSAFDEEMWKQDGDILIFLECENMSKKKPIGRPSFRLHEKVLRASGSIVLISLLDDFRRNRDSMLLPPANDAGYFHTPANYPGAEKDSKVVIQSYICLPPDDCTTEAEIEAFNLGTRNALSLLYKGSLIGYTTYEALHMLQKRLCDFFGEPEPGNKLIIDYGIETKFLDPRYDLSKAASILAFAEEEDVRWENGYLEGFVHCVGMYNYLHIVPEFRFIKPATKALLQRYNLDLQHRIQQAEKRLGEFSFEDMWIFSEGDSPSARDAFMRTKDFFRQYYAAKFGSWPTKPDHGSKTWLTRSQVCELQTDFNALYDYYVDRSVFFHVQETHLATYIGNMVRIVRANDPNFDPDADGVRMTQILKNFDRSNGYPPIPYPFPVLPESIPVTTGRPDTSESTEKQPKTDKMLNIFKKKNKAKEEKQAALDNSSTEKTVDPLKENEFRMVYSAATNLLVLKDQYTGSALVDAFEAFEQNDKIGEVDPHIVRRGRWILIYGVLQVLASISNDTPNLVWEGQDKVKYFLNPKLEGCPPWGTSSYPEADRMTSHCYTASQSWPAREGTPSGRVVWPRYSEQPYPDKFSTPPSVAASNEEDMWQPEMVGSPTLTNNSNSGYGYSQKQLRIIEPPTRPPPNPPIQVREQVSYSDFPTRTANGGRPDLQSRADSRQQEIYSEFPNPNANGSRSNLQLKKANKHEQPPAMTELYLQKPLPDPLAMPQRQHQDVRSYEHDQQVEDYLQSPDDNYDEEPSSPGDVAGYGQATKAEKPPVIFPVPKSRRKKELERQAQLQEAQKAFQQQPPQPQFLQQERMATPECQRLEQETPEYVRQHIPSEYANSRTATPHSQYQQSRTATPQWQQPPQSLQEHEYDLPQPGYQRGTLQHLQSYEDLVYRQPQPAFAQNQRLATPPRREPRAQSPDNYNYSYEVPQPAFQQQQRMATPPRRVERMNALERAFIPPSPLEGAFLPPQPLFVGERTGTPPRVQQYHYESPQTARRRENFEKNPRPSQKFPRPASPLKFNDWDNPTADLP